MATKARRPINADFIDGVMMLGQMCAAALKVSGVALPRSEATFAELARIARKASTARDGDIGLLVAANLLDALAQFDAAWEAYHLDGQRLPELLIAVARIGNEEAMFALHQTGILMEYANRRYAWHQSVEHGKTGAQERRRGADVWKGRAVAAFVARSNKELKPESWAASQADKFERKPGTVAKAIRAAMNKSRTNPA